MKTLPDGVERRRDVRLAAGPKVDAVLVDHYQYPIQVFRDAQLLNVSAGGLAMISPGPAEKGDVLNVVWGQKSTPLREQEPLRVEVLDCSSWRGQDYKIRCKLVRGKMPAEMIYGW